MPSPRPIVNFTTLPPVIFKCGGKKRINFTVKPNAIGDCELIFTLSATSHCSFANQATEIRKTVTATDPDKVIDSFVDIAIDCDESDTYYMLLYSTAVNANGRKSFRKSLETIINCEN